MKIKKLLLCATVGCLLAGAGAANAQGIILRTNEPYTGLVLDFSMDGPIAPVARTWTVTTADKTIREVLAKWAQAAGWTFNGNLWNIDRDFPIIGNATITQPEFQDAVRTLLDSTLSTDRPVHPCFYSNKIVRVVPLSESCQRSPVEGNKQ